MRQRILHLKSQLRGRNGSNSGFTLLELLVVMAVISILGTLGWTQLRPPEAQLYAHNLRAQVQQARLEAIKRNRPVAVIWNGDAGAFVTRVQNDPSGSLCSGGTPILLTRSAAADYRTVTVESAFTLKAGVNGVVWHPNGRIRLCDNTLIEAPYTRTTVRDSRTTLYVRVTPGGKVELADAP